MSKLSKSRSEAFAKRLKILMIERDKSSEDIAQVLGLTKKSVSDYMSTNHSPTVEIVCRLADYFGVTVDFLLGRSGSVIFDMGYPSSERETVENE